jgi:hypothetical protein
MKKQALIIMLLALSMVLPSFAQQRWVRTYGGAGIDFANDARQTSDGGYIVVGATYSFGVNSRVYLIKTDSLGDTLWTRTFLGTDIETGTSVQPTTDGGYIITGVLLTISSGEKAFLLKTDSLGDSLWYRTYGDTSEGGQSVAQTNDGGYILAGTAGSYGNVYQVYLVRTDGSGDTLWTRTFGGPGWDYGYSVQPTRDGNYIVAGSAGAQVYLLKVDDKGDTLWTRAYGDGAYEVAFSVQQTQDGGYIAAGQRRIGFPEDSSMVYLLKTDSSGDLLWSRTYGQALNAFGSSVDETQDGGFVVAGYTYFWNGTPTVYLLRTTPSGDSLWTRTFGGLGWEKGNSVRQTSDGGYIIAGANGDVLLIKTDGNGNVGIAAKPDCRLKAVAKITAKPNPFISYATIPGYEKEGFLVYDVAGRMVGTFKGERIGEGLGAGVYFVKAQTRSEAPCRIVKLR